MLLDFALFSAGTGEYKNSKRGVVKELSERRHVKAEGVFYANSSDKLLCS